MSRPRATLLIAAVAWFSWPGRDANAQQLGGDQAVRLANASRLVSAPELQDARPYIPILRQALTVELHFAKKVVQPDEQALAEIHRAGLRAIPQIAQQYAQLEHRRKKPETWPDPNLAIAEVLGDSIAEVVSRAVAEKYRSEIEGRFAANRAAHAAAIVNLIDEKVLLSVQQQHQLSQALRDDWQPHWSTGRTVLVYAESAALPEIDVLRPHLSPLQLRLWAYRSKIRRSTPPWHEQFGANNLFGTTGLQEFADPEPLESSQADEEAK